MTIEIKTNEHPETQLTEVKDFEEIWSEHADPGLGDAESMDCEESYIDFLNGGWVVLSEGVKVRQYEENFPNRA